MIYAALSDTAMAHIGTEGEVPRPAKIERYVPIERLHTIARREGNAKKAVYEMHKWWARRLGSNFRMLLLGATRPASVHGQTLWSEFYKPQDMKGMVVFDPFMGGGTSIVEATKMGARTIGSDIDPVAWFITKKEVEPFDETAVRRAFKDIEAKVKNRVSDFYDTILPDGRRAAVTNFFWVTVVTCSDCGDEIEAHPHYLLFHDKANKRKTVFCPECGEVQAIPGNRVNFVCTSCCARVNVNDGTTRGGVYQCACGHSAPLLEGVKPGKPLCSRLFALEWEIPGESRTEHERGFIHARSTDLATMERARAEFERLRDTLPFPRAKIPTDARRDNRPVNYGYEHYYQLFNPRQLLTLSLIYEQILAVVDEATREYLLLAFSDCLASNNMLCPYAFGYRKLTPLFGLHAYRMITRPVEGNTWGSYFGRGSFEKCVEKVVRGKAYCKEPYEYVGEIRDTHATGERIEAKVTTNAEAWKRGEANALLLNRSSHRLPEVADATVDIILTDPPYYNNLPYSELSDFYYVWLRGHLPEGARWTAATTPYKESLYVNRQSEQQQRKYRRGMAAVFKECRRVIKPSGLLIFTYHHLDYRAWEALGDALISSGFEVTSVFPLLAEGKSGFHSSEGNIKWDAVFCCRPSEVWPRNNATWNEAISSARERALAWRDYFAGTELRFSPADLRSFQMAILAAEASVERPSLSHLGKALKSLSKLHPTKKERTKRKQSRKFAHSVYPRWFLEARRATTPE